MTRHHRILTPTRAIRTGACLLGMLLSFHCLALADETGESEISVDDVISALRQRQTAIVSLKASWSRTLHYGEDRLAQSRVVEHRPELVTYRHSVADVRESCWLMNEQLRTWTSSLSAVGTVGPVVNEYANNGVLHQQFLPEIGGTGQGIVDEAGDNSMQREKSSSALRAVLLAARPLDAEVLNLSRWNYRIRESRETIGVASCVVIEQTGSKSGIQRVAWLDPKCDLAIRKYAELSSLGEVTFELTAEFDHQSDGFWLPTSWSTGMFTRDGKLVEEARVERVTYEVNPKLADEDFVVTFPAGARILDLRGTGEKRLVVSADGRWTPAVPNARPASTQGVPLGSGTIVLLNVGAVAAVAVWIIVRRYRTSNR